MDTTKMQQDAEAFAQFMGLSAEDGNAVAYYWKTRDEYFAARQQECRIQDEVEMKRDVFMTARRHLISKGIISDERKGA